MPITVPPEKSPQALDVVLSGGKIFHMMRRLFGSVIRASVLEAVTPMFADLREGQRRLEDRMDRLELRMNGLDEKIEGLRKDVFHLKSEMADVRVEVAALRGDVGTLRVEVNSLNRDRDSADHLAHRVMRIEDHLFAKA